MVSTSNVLNNAHSDKIYPFWQKPTRPQEVSDQDFLSGESLSKTSRFSNIRKIPFAFKPQPSLNLTPTLYFELRFPTLIINGYDREANACNPWTSYYVLLIILVNIRGLFLQKIKKALELLMLFKKYQMNPNVNQTKYGQIDKESEFYNRIMKSWLKDNGIEMDSTYNKAKYVATEGIIRTLRNKIF